MMNALNSDDTHIMEHIFLVSQSKEDIRVAKGLKMEDVRRLLDVVEFVQKLDTLPEECPRLQDLYQTLDEVLNPLPPSLPLVDGMTVGSKTPFKTSGSSDIFQGVRNGKVVALKRMRALRDGPCNVLPRVHREALTWVKLHHQYILPLIGIYREPSSLTLYMVSPWVEGGTTVEHLTDLKSTGTVDVLHVNRLLFQIAQGIQYLHSQPEKIVHGDLRGRNVLVAKDGSARIIDFGYSRSSVASIHLSRGGGSIRWMAPELVNDHPSVQTFASDVYAFGCLCAELYTLKDPFSNIPHEYRVVRDILQGKRPERPTENPLMTDGLWEFVNTCWLEKPAARPSADILVSEMRVAAESH
ncbi:kinase-like domain-containing protein [Mycena rosella]|uniref:Kinase-like domain-containing protein n=1 Tax=Mycena rosella TaxID=1033263 RepID=A0AAD7G584_MYCRO|nr:kinase-like domain-containing protein [Mycena rosella]